MPPTSLVLRPYQERGVEIAGQLWKSGVRRILLQLPTGGGKTVIAARFLSGAVAKGRRALFLAHRREIVAQSYAKLHADGVPLASMGLLMAEGVINHPETGKPFKAVNPAASVIVASIATWSARPTKPPAEVVFIDEAHHCAAGTWKKVIDHYVGAGAVVIGLTATPVRGDGKGLHDLFDQLVPIERMSALVEGGYLCRAKVFVGGKIEALEGVKIRGGDYEIGKLQDVMRNAALVGDIIENWKRHHEGRTTVVFATGVDHSLDIVRRFREAGASAEHLDGTTPTEERDAILRRLASGETQIVSNAMVLTEGWDLPRCKLCVLARPTKSLGLYLQMAGRVLRPWEGVVPKILDHSSTANIFGPPDIDRVWTLGGKSLKDKEDEKKPSFPHCEKCHAILAIGQRVCTECGHEKEIVQIHETKEDLVELQWKAAQAAADESPMSAEDLVEQAKANAAERLRHDITREIGRVAWKVMESNRVKREDIITALNREIYRRLGNRSRSTASPEVLELELAWLRTRDAAGPVAVVVKMLGLTDQPVTAPTPAPPTEKKVSQLGFAGFAGVNREEVIVPRRVKATPTTPTTPTTPAQMTAATERRYRSALDTASRPAAPPRPGLDDDDGFFDEWD